jgi:phosphodiesterase/alkaline phosphatase D-like protein
LLLLGDNVYLPARHKPKSPADLRQQLKIQYDRLLSDPHFSALLAHLSGGDRKVAATWDDHDFLGGAKYAQDFADEYREAAKAQFFESFGFAAQPPHIYRSFELGDAKFVLLDCRSWRKPPDKGPGQVEDVLGAEQLEWLRGQLQHDRKYTVVCSSLSFYNHPGPQHERWDQHPAARAELLRLLAGRAGVLMLSGDIHRNGAMDDDNLIELVSSGVSRKHQWWFWQVLRNYAVLDLDAQGAMVSFYEKDPSNNKTFSMPLSDWRLTDICING